MLQGEEEVKDLYKDTKEDIKKSDEKNLRFYINSTNNYCHVKEGKIPSSLLTIYQVMVGLTLEGKNPSTFGQVIF